MNERSLAVRPWDILSLCTGYGGLDLMADGLTAWPDTIRMLGNGVVPVVGALAFSTLWRRLKKITEDR